MSWLSLEGGNVVANRRHVFVGATVYADNLLAPPQLVDEELRRVVGRDYIIVSDERLGVPWEHVDMFLTPIDETTVLLASEALARTLLAPGVDDAELEFTDIDSSLGFCPSDKIQDQLDGIAQALRGQGYRVLSLPAIFNNGEDWVINYNNVLMERRDGRRIVYMPVYHIPQLDVVAEAVYASEGFEVFPIDVSKLYRHGGALRCIANVTRRRQSTASSRPADSPEIRVMDVTSVDQPRTGRTTVSQRARASTRNATLDRS
jgi:N-dimethylarginine dimethylaminohydrolase